MRQKIKNFAALTLCITLCLSFCHTVTTPQAEAVFASYINDPGLKAAINNKLNQDYPNLPNRTFTHPINLEDLLNLRNDLDASCEEVKNLGFACISNISGIEKAENLDYLDLSGNRIRILPDNINNLRSLAEIDLSDNVLESLPAQIWQLRNLRMLVLANNPLNILANDISNNRKLLVLALSGTKIKNLPASIKNLSQLETLSLNNNELSQIPEDIKDIASLRIVDLSSNELTNIPNDIDKLINLERLLLDNNDLESLPNSLKNIAQLKLQVQGNHLANISGAGDTAFVEARFQNINGGEIVAPYNPNVPVCKIITLPVASDGTSIFPKEDSSYTFTAAAGETPVRTGTICWHNVKLNQQRLQYLFDAGAQTIAGGIYAHAGIVSFNLITTPKLVDKSDSFVKNSSNLDMVGLVAGVGAIGLGASVDQVYKPLVAGVAEDTMPLIGVGAVSPTAGAVELATIGAEVVEGAEAVAIVAESAEAGGLFGGPVGAFIGAGIGVAVIGYTNRNYFKNFFK